MKRFLCACIVALTGLALAQPTAASTLEKVRKSGTFTIGFRLDARPFSFLDADGQAAGYAVDICRRIAVALRGNLGLADMNVEYVPVKAANRIEMLESDEIDIECGSSTRTLRRQERVDFTLLTFVTGAEMLVRVDSGIGDIPDLAGRKVGVLEGTTTERGLRNALEKRFIDAQVVTVERHDYGLASLEVGDIDAYFADRILLLGLAGRAMDPSKLQLSGRLYSIEPYALMVRRGDDDLRLIADRTIASLYRSGQIKGIAGKWFGGAKAGNLLKALYLLQAIPEQ